MASSVPADWLPRVVLLVTKVSGVFLFGSFASPRVGQVTGVAPATGAVGASELGLPHVFLGLSSTGAAAGASARRLLSPVSDATVPPAVSTTLVSGLA